MAYSETQLQTWSHQGSKIQSAATYEAVRSVLEDRSAPYASRYFEIFLQGSYGNDTNIYSDSDVDIVICLTSVYYHDLGNLDQSQRNVYDINFSPATYSWGEFRTEVLEWLRTKFGSSSVVDGKKVIFIRGNGQRRDADVLVCAEHRRYFAYHGPSNNRFAKGIVFWSSGTEIVNFPKQHRENCVTKHQSSSFRFKPNVRVLKNYRNNLIDARKLADGVAPSYFLEGLLWNMPNSLFDVSFTTTMNNFVGWVGSADVTNLTCANDLYYLVRDNSPVCWPNANFRAYVSAVQADW